MGLKYLPWLIGGLLNAQIILPFDWVNQAGITIQDGNILWNQDWVSGPLLFDGTYTSFPKKFGMAVSDRFQLLRTGDSRELPHLPDSAFTTSSINYYRGDHFYDQLGLKADFGEKDRLISLNGFKRNYGGDHGHYLYPGQGLGPIQQSYRFDYVSKFSNSVNSFALGRFITHSGLPDSTVNGRIDDDILSAGLMGLKKGSGWNINYHGSIFTQRRKIIHSTRMDSSRTYLNRVMFSIKIRQGGFGAGLFASAQSIAADNFFRNLHWGGLYGEYSLGPMRVLAGLSLLDDQKSKPYYRVVYTQVINKSRILADISFEHNPRHPYFNRDSLSQQFDSWHRARVNYQFESGKFRGQVFLSAGKSSNEYFGRKAIYKSITLKADWELISGWHLNTEYLNQQDTTLYLPRIGSLVRIGLKGSFYLFKQNLKLNSHLWAQGWLDRKAGFKYDLLNEVPLLDSGSAQLPSQWNLNFEASAVVKSVVLSYRLMNILNIVDSFTNGLKENQVWLRPTSFYPPLGRFITFGVSWQFRD
ncbi:MAG: hypothetical protein V3S22_03265 [Candidatus Neomarinimicrobiota bacterium]